MWGVRGLRDPCLASSLGIPWILKNLPFFLRGGEEVLILISFYKSLKGKYLRVQVRVEEWELRG